MTAGAAALLAEAAAAEARLEARLWCDAPDRLDRTLRDALAVQRPAVLRLLLDRPVGEGEATPAGTAAEGSAAPAPAPLHPDDDPEHQARLDGYQRAALRRPPSLPMDALPGMGCYCMHMLRRATMVVRARAAFGLALLDLLPAGPSRT